MPVPSKWTRIDNPFRRSLRLDTSPTRGGKDSVCTAPSGGGKDSCVSKVSECPTTERTVCPKTVSGTPHRGTTKGFCASMDISGGSSAPVKYHQRRILTPIQTKTDPIQKTSSCQWLQRQHQRQCISTFYSGLTSKRGHRRSKYRRVTRILQPTIPSAKAWKSLEASDRPQLTQQISSDTKIQNGNSRIHTGLSQTGRMGNLNRPDGRLPPHSNPQVFQKISEVPPQRGDFPVYQPPLRFSYGPPGIHGSSKGSQALGPKEPHQDTPVPRRLAPESTVQAGGSHPNQGPLKSSTTVRLPSESQEVRTISQPEVRLHWISFHAGSCTCKTHARKVGETAIHVQDSLSEVCPDCKNTYVNNWVASINREDCKVRQDPYETFSMASQSSLEISNASELDNPMDTENDTTRGLVVRPTKRDVRRISSPQGTRNSHIYRRLKRRLGRSLRKSYSKRSLVSDRKTSAYKRPRAEGSNPSSSSVSSPVREETSVNSLRQHHSSVIHKQARRHTLHGNVCPHVETTHLVQQVHDHTQSTTRTGVTQCNSRCVITKGTGSINRVVPVPTNIQEDSQNLGIPSSGLICNQPEQEVTDLRVSHPGSGGMGSGLPQHIMGQHGCLCIPSNGSPTQDHPEAPITVVQANPDRTGLAHKAMVLGPSGIVSRPTQTTSSNTVTTQTTIEPSVPQPTGVPESPRVVSRSSALQAQGFSAEVADRIAAPQRLSTRRIYENKWMVFSKWCTQKQVDVRSPSIKDICDFLCYLFTDLNRRPSTIEGYRTALADRLESTGLCISANLEVSRLIASFHRDNPKCARMIPKWNLSLVLHQLTLAPFEPMEEASLKFLTWKTVFLLTLASGKRRSEIHAWTLEGLLSLGDWDQVQLSPSPSFIAKNQLARDGPASIAPVVIPALSEASTTNQSDILLCPIRILRHYLARTGDLRTDQKLLFISFKPGFNKDIRPSTVSSWIKKTILYCYSKIEDADLDAINVKAHDVRAFAASKAFQTGVSMDQIMSACHWKSQNTFTKFYLKDLSGKDQKDHNYHLRSFVAAQQVVTAP